MDDKELDKAVTEYRSKKRCSGHCDRVLPNTSEFFITDVKRNRGNRQFLRAKCRDCVKDDKREASLLAQYESESDHGVEMSYEEIGNALGISRQRVEVIYNRAIEKLKKIVKREKLI